MHAIKPNLKNRSNWRKRAAWWQKVIPGFRSLSLQYRIAYYSWVSTLHITCNNINFICNFKVWIVHLADHIINSKTVASKWFEYVQININMRWSWILMDLERLSFLKMMDWSREERNRLFTRLSCLVYIWEVYLTSQNSPSWAFIDWWLILVKYAFVGFIIRCTSFFRRCVC